MILEVAVLFLPLLASADIGKTEDLCLLPPETGPCKAAEYRYYYDPVERRCQSFTYGGCGGNGNNFDSKAACESACFGGKNACLLTPDMGPCSGSYTRWFYNPSTKSCEPFLYGGCQGNANNFKTPQQCETYCRPLVNVRPPPTSAPVDPCMLPVQPGPCLAYIERWYYDQQLHICMPFIYGGCNANANNFITYDKCMNQCSPLMYVLGEAF